MRDWLAVATTVDGVTTYSKDPNSMIHMIRDRARVNFRYMFDFKRANSDVEPNDVVTAIGRGRASVARMVFYRPQKQGVARPNARMRDQKRG
jgi:hypothetical protein